MSEVDWQPIATAPKAVKTQLGQSNFGERVLLAAHTWADVAIGRWYFWEGDEGSGCWVTDGPSHAGEPTHWMSLPLPPTA